MLTWMQLVDSIETFREHTHITQEWFGIVLLPIVSFSADGAVAIGYFIKRTVSHLLKLKKPEPPTTLAKAEAIDLSIQFLLFWTPFVMLLGWWLNKPFNLLFGEWHLLDAASPRITDIYSSRLLRGRDAPRGMLPSQLCHPRCEDKLDRGLNFTVLLRYDSEWVSVLKGSTY